jgi:hypothetical protein
MSALVKYEEQYIYELLYIIISEARTVCEL